MKKFTLIFGMLTMVSIVLTAQPQLTWQFANFEVINAGTQLQFDVEVKSSSVTFHRDLQVYFDYNTTAFGSDIVAGGNVAVTPLSLMATHYVIVNSADNTSSKFAVITEASNEMTQSGSATYFNEITTTYQGLLRFTIDVLPGMNTAMCGIAFDQDLMNGGQYYQSTSTTDPIKYADLCLYEGDISSYILSAGTGAITYANLSSTPLNDVTVKLMLGAVEIGSDVTNSSGEYNVSNIADGVYTLETVVTKPRGGTSIADVIKTRQSMSSLWTFTPLEALAADVSGGGIGIADVIMMRQKMSSITNPGWIAPDFVFLPETITVSGGIGTTSYQTLCSGDPAPSYTPPAN